MTKRSLESRLSTLEARVDALRPPKFGFIMLEHWVGDWAEKQGTEGVQLCSEHTNCAITSNYFPAANLKHDIIIKEYV